jgi:DNA end-binding protein Ku
VGLRANWKGYLKLGEIVTAISLHTAVSTSDRIAFHTLNRKTGNRVHRQFVDSETGMPVEHDDQVKGYETDQGEYVVLEPEEIAAAIPDSDKTMTIQAFVPCHEIDKLYFDRPYFLRPDSPTTSGAFNLLREGMASEKVAALARTVLFRRVRTLLVRPHENGLIATTLNFDYEVRSASAAFKDIPKIKIQGEMLELAQHIIGTKEGSFDPKAFGDRYEDALAELVHAKLAGRKIKPISQPKSAKVVSLLDALRASATAKGTGSEPTVKPKQKKRPAARASDQRKAG